MKTTILSILMLLFTSFVYGQLMNDALQKITFKRNKSDSLVHSFEDILLGRSKTERQFVESLKNGILFIDDRREIRNIMSLYDFSTSRIDSVFLEQPFGDLCDNYISSYLQETYIYLDSNQVFLQEHQQNVDNPSPRVSSLLQAITHSDYQWQMNDFEPMWNYPKEAPFYIPNIAFSPEQIKFDENDPIFTIPYLDTVYKRDIVNQLELIRNPYDKYRSYLLFMENLATRHLALDLFETGSFLSQSITNDRSIDSDFKIQSLTAITKILAAVNDEKTDLIAMTNYGRLYALIDTNDRYRMNGVKRMEIQMLNRQAKDNPRKNRFVLEGFRILHELLESDNDLYREQEYLENNLLLGELLVSQLKSRRDLDYPFSDSDYTYFNNITQWRIVNILIEFEKFERKNGELPKEYHSRLFQILFDFYSVKKDKEGILRSILTSLKYQNGRAQLLDAVISVIPDLLLSIGEIEESKKWANQLHGYAIDFIFEDVMEEPMHMHLTGRLNRTPSLFIDDDKEYWLSPSSDTLIDRYIGTINSWDNISNGYKKIIKEEAWAYQEFEAFFAENGAYKKAYVFSKMARLAIGGEADTEFFNDMVNSRTSAYAETRREVLRKKNDEMHTEVINRNTQILQLNQLIQHQENEIIKKDMRIKEKDEYILLQDSLISQNNFEIEKTKKELTEINREKSNLHAKTSQLSADYNNLERKYGSLEKNIHQKNVLIIILFVAMALIVFALVYAWKNKRRAEKSEAEAKDEKEKALFEKRRAEENEALVIIEKENVERERNFAIGLKQSINQIGHLCQKGITNITNQYFLSSNDENIIQGHKMLSRLSGTFRSFTTNRNKTINTIENEVHFAIELLYSQNPSFCKGKSTIELLQMIQYKGVEQEKVPIYTIVNVINNFFKHSIPNLENRLVISTTTERDFRIITLKCFAEQDPVRGGAKEGTNYCTFMIQTVYGGGDDVFTHFSVGEQEYHNIMKLKRA